MTKGRIALPLMILTTVSLVCGLTIHANTEAGELIENHCAATVSIPASFTGHPADNGAVVLQRSQNNETTDWTPPFQVKPGNEGRIRWWCNSTKWNPFTLNNTPKIKGAIGNCVATTQVASSGNTREAADDIKCPTPSRSKSLQWESWTKESARCDDDSTWIRARLEANRLLLIECLGNHPQNGAASFASPALDITRPPVDKASSINEQICQQLLESKLAWADAETAGSQSGSKINRNTGTIHKLCINSMSPKQTIRCFMNQLNAGQSWQYATTFCGVQQNQEQG